MLSPPQILQNEVPLLGAVHFTYWLLWAGSLAVSVTLIVLLLTRWGHSRPLHKCAVLSLIVHLTLAFLTMTVKIVSGDGSGPGEGGGIAGGGPPIHVHIVEDAPKPATKAVAATAPPVTEIAAPPLLTPPPKPEVPVAAAEPEKKAAEPAPASIVEAKKAPESSNTIVESRPQPSASVAASKPSSSKSSEKPEPAAAAAGPVGEVAVSSKADIASSSATATVAPGTYALRTAQGRLGLVAGQGGSAQTEAAVTAALRWLAGAQSRDGRWDAVQYGAGQEQMVLGQNRGGAGRGADTGVTALALLAFLGAGNTHTQGEYQDNVRRGLDFLLRSQAADGSLFGDATLYAQMYCHSMATFALAESQAVTGDRRIGDAVTKAVNFSLSAQNTSTGGWRYRPGDTGDTSQLGWQIMALTSAQSAGIDVPDQTWVRVDRFLQSVRRGSAGGLSSYRPDSPTSTSMTAEALYCRLMLAQLTGSNLPDAAADEAASQLLGSVPNSERINLYYWYYATLALHHRQNASAAAAGAWRTWNDAMTTTLTKTQVTGGENAGSWETNCLWGGYGGRVYQTAMAAMCLEVYYRYAPAPKPHVEWMATRPQASPGAR
jgi:outer membrane biosynthesis protein TonB